MAVQINEVVVRATIIGSECGDEPKANRLNAATDKTPSVSTTEVLDLITEMLTTKKER